VAVASTAAGKGNHQSKEDSESGKRNLRDITKKDKKTGKRIFESNISD
jgi:hypothetical protein